MTIDTTADDMRDYAEKFIEDIDVPAALTTPNMDGLIQLTLRLLAELADQIERVNALEARMESLSEVNGAHAESLDTLENKVMQNEIDICRVGDSVTEMRIRGSVGF